MEPNSTGGVPASTVRADMRTRRLITALLVPGGVVTGHALGYLVTDTARHGWQPTYVSHGVYPTAAALALLAAFVGVAVAALARIPGRSVVPRLRVLAGAQVAGFLAMEGVERFVAGSTLSGFLHDPLLWVLAAAQLVAAAVWVLVVRGVRGAASALRGRVAVTVFDPTATTSLPQVRRTGGAAVHVGTLSVRGPPAAVSPAA